MSTESIVSVATMGIDIGKNSFHVVGFDQRGAIEEIAGRGGGAEARLGAVRDKLERERIAGHAAPANATFDFASDSDGRPVASGEGPHKAPGSPPSRGAAGEAVRYRRSSASPKLRKDYLASVTI